jgi:hypothetical protein
MAIQAVPLSDRFVQKLFRIHRIVAFTTQGSIILPGAEFVIGTGERCMAYGTLPYDKGAVKIFVLGDGSVAFGRHAAPERIGMLFLFGCRSRYRIV